MSSQIYKTVTVKCKNCFFVGNYHNCSIESVKTNRNFMSKIKSDPQIPCNHSDYYIEVTEN